MLANLVVDLDERYDTQRAAHEKRMLEALGFYVTGSHDLPGRVLAWIDDEFGGTWSSEAHHGTNVVAMSDDEPAGFATFDPQGLRFGWLRGAASEEGNGSFRPVRSVIIRIADRRSVGRYSRLAFCDFALAAIGARSSPRSAHERSLRTTSAWQTARVAEEFDPLTFVPRPPRTIILASGTGTNAQAVIDDVRGGLPLDLVGVVTNGPTPSSWSAQSAPIATRHVVLGSRAAVPRRSTMTRSEAVAAFQPELVLLLGWMHLLDARFVSAFPELLNIHPAFLPLDSSRDIVGMPDAAKFPHFAAHTRSVMHSPPAASGSERRRTASHWKPTVGLSLRGGRCSLARERTNAPCSTACTHWSTKPCERLFAAGFTRDNSVGVRGTRLLMKHASMALAAILALSAGTVAAAQTQAQPTPGTTTQQTTTTTTTTVDQDPNADLSDSAAMGPNNQYGDPICGTWSNGTWTPNGHCPSYATGPRRARVTGTITAVKGHLVTVQQATRSVTINDQPALNREMTGKVAVGRQVVAYGYWAEGNFYATIIE